MNVRRSWISLSAGMLLLMSGCATEVSPGPDAGDSGVADLAFEGVTYQEHIRPILEQNCVQCHRQDGIAPLPFESWDEVEPYGAEIVQVVRSGLMPPWLPTDECEPLRDNRQLTEAQRALFDEWGFDGHQPGDPADYRAPETDSPLALGAPDLEILPLEGYQPDRDLPDDYRCLPLDYTFERDMYLTATDIVPEVRDMVHHVIFYLVPPDAVERLETLDANDDGPGYTCYGDSRINSAVLVGGWVPGSPAFVWPEDAAFRMAEGSRIVAQFHYNLVNYGRDDEVPTDRSTVQLWTLPEGETPDRLIDFTLFANFTIDIPAGDPRSIHESELLITSPTEVVALIPHMHTLGDAIRLDWERASAPDEAACLIDIPRWDFAWQQLYNYPDNAPIQLDTGDMLTLRCEYDNSASNQPVVNGERGDPRNVAWGDGTFDEMCLAYIATARPFTDLSAGMCGDRMPQCFEACEGDGNCAYACIQSLGGTCGDCMTGAVVDCGRRECLAELATLGSCVDTCEDFNICLSIECASEFDSFYGCLEEPLLAGACDEDLVACEVQFAPDE